MNVASAEVEVGFRMMKVEGLITLRTVLFVSLHLRQLQEHPDWDEVDDTEKASKLYSLSDSEE